MASQLLPTITIRRVMDEHESTAFELELILLRHGKTAELVPAYRKALQDSIENHRELSRTYRPYVGDILKTRLRNTS